MRVSVTYLITITLVNNKKIDFKWDFAFYFYWNHEIRYPQNVIPLMNCWAFIKHLVSNFCQNIGVCFDNLS